MSRLAYPQSWHTCGFDDKSAYATCNILMTKVHKSTYFGEIFNKLRVNDNFLGKNIPFYGEIGHFWSLLITISNPQKNLDTVRTLSWLPYSTDSCYFDDKYQKKYERTQQGNLLQKGVTDLGG